MGLVLLGLLVLLVLLVLLGLVLLGLLGLLGLLEQPHHQLLAPEPLSLAQLVLSASPDSRRSR